MSVSVSVSQISIDRSHDRSIDQSRFLGQSLDQSICVCRCLYKEQHPPTRSYFRRKIHRPADLLSLSLHLIPSKFPCAHTTCPRRSHEVASFRIARGSLPILEHRVSSFQSQPHTRNAGRVPIRLSDSQENSRCWKYEMPRPRNYV